MATKKKPEDDDPTLAAELDRALAPYKKLVPPEMLEVYRDILRHSLTEHPVGKRLLDRVRELDRKSPDKSGEKLKEGVKIGPEADVPSTGRKPGDRT